MDSYTLDRLTDIAAMYKRMMKEAQEEQAKYLVPSSDFEGAKKVDMQNHARWASAVTKESICSYVVQDIETVLKEYFERQQRQLEEFRTSEGKQ